MKSKNELTSFMNSPSLSPSPRQTPPHPGCLEFIDDSDVAHVSREPGVRETLVSCETFIRSRQQQRLNQVPSFGGDLGELRNINLIFTLKSLGHCLEPGACKQSVISAELCCQQIC